MSKTIFITGASRGFGKLWTEAFLKRGDKVAASARDISALNELVEKYGDAFLPVELDVNDRIADFAAVERVKKHFGSIDVLINNAGYGLFGAIEETTEEQARAQMETNFFGLLWMTQAVLSVMREQGSGHIIQVSSFLGMTTMPVLGLYNASKFAVEGLSETLAAEVNEFGIHVTMLEPNGFSTDWSGASAIQTEPASAYDKLRQRFNAAVKPEHYGKPEATVNAVLHIVDSEYPPLRLLLGKVAYPAVKDSYETKLQLMEEWKEVSIAAHGY
jgi:NAD(P)-dependent dehydrogenase (short-subunit alcohol dehydrogenase family)